MSTENDNKPGQQPDTGKPAPKDGAADNESNSKGWEAAKALKAEVEQKTKELNALKASAEKRDQDEAAKRGEFEKLFNEEKAKREALEQKSARVLKRSALLDAGSKLGLVDADALNLIDFSKVEIADDGESVKNAAEIMAEFSKSKPYLFAANQKTNNANTKAAPPGAGAPAGKNFDGPFDQARAWSDPDYAKHFANKR